MSRDAEHFSEVGRGPLARWSAGVYWALVIEVLVVLTSLPGLLLVAALDRSLGNVPFVALAAVPIGPALAAAVFAWRDYLHAAAGDRDLAPARHYWRGYRQSWRDVLLWWVPTLVVLAVLGVNASAGGAFTIVSLVLAAGVLVWAGNALVLSSLFAFRTRDVARLAAYYLAAKPLVTLGVVSLLVVGVAVAVSATDLLLALLASVLVLMLVRNAGPVVADVTERFTHDGPGPSPRLARGAGGTSHGEDGPTVRGQGES
ncbi:YesL family protein [Cellulomonas sp. URHB0016]